MMKRLVSFEDKKSFQELTLKEIINILNNSFNVSIEGIKYNTRKQWAKIVYIWQQRRKEER